MFGDRSEQWCHEKKLAEIKAKSDTLSNIVQNADLNKVVILPSVILKLAFITEIIYNPSEKKDRN